MGTMMKAGFENGVEGSGAVFRSLMEAMSEPAGVVAFSPVCETPESIYTTTAGILLTLLDHDTKVQLVASSSEVADWVRFHTAASIVEGGQMHFVLVGLGADDTMVDIDGLPIGSPEYPERSATLIIEVEGFGAGDTFEASGPGIDGCKTFSVAGFAGKWQGIVEANRGIFPQGIDLILVSPEGVLCLPRTTTLNTRRR